MYKKIKDNITSPRKIYLSRNDSGKKIVGYIAFLVLLLLIPTIISTLTYKGLEPEDKRILKNELKTHLNIDCEIDGKLVCSDESFIKTLNFDGFDIVIDPGSNFVPTNFTSKVVLTEDFVKVLFSKTEVAKFTYDDLPSDWHNLNFDIEDEMFWDSLFNGFNELINNYRSVWIGSALIAYTFVFIFLILFEALFDSFIISLFRFGRLKFKETFKIVIYSMTLYVIIRVILELYNIKISGMYLSLLQMIPLTYALIAHRNAYRE